MKVKKLPIKVLHQFNDQNAARANAGLPVIKKKILICLKCQEYFESAGNRLCYECHQVNKRTTTTLMGIEAI